MAAAHLFNYEFRVSGFRVLYINYEFREPLARRSQFHILGIRAHFYFFEFH